MTLKYKSIEIYVKQNSALKTPFFFIVHHSRSSQKPKLSIGSLIKKNKMWSSCLTQEECFKSKIFLGIAKDVICERLFDIEAI